MEGYYNAKCTKQKNSSALTPSDFHHFVHLKDGLRRRHFVNDNLLKHSLREAHRRFSKQFYATGTRRLTHSYKMCVDNEGDFKKNNLNFVKDLSFFIRKFRCKL
jgi:hypothetical protein